ncbi:MAG: hypothetical protein WKF35_06220 [Ferruginibacter sp.]
MKKLFLIFLICCSALHSFSQINQSSFDVVAQIQNINVQLSPKYPEGSNERKWWQTLLNACTIVCADAAGAYAGVTGSMGVIGAVGLSTGGSGAAVVAGVVAVVGAAGASNGAYHGLNRSLPHTGEVSFGNLNILIPQQFSAFSEIGKAHNRVLQYNFINGENIQNYYTTVLLPQDMSIINSTKIQQMFTDLNTLGLAATRGQNNYEMVSTNLVGSNYMTVDGKNIYDAFFAKYLDCNSASDLENLINGAINSVSNSALNETEKQSLITAFIVTSESAFFTK